MNEILAYCIYDPSVKNEGYVGTFEGTLIFEDDLILTIPMLDKKIAIETWIKRDPYKGASPREMMDINQDIMESIHNLR